MQQHLMQMQPMMAAYYPNNVTTDHIQQLLCSGGCSKSCVLKFPSQKGCCLDCSKKYLDENKSLIIKIVESQNSGKLSECAENQARLQRNLMYLAAIADSQPQPPAMHSQFPPSGIPQAGGHYLQHQQAQQMSQQALMAARSSMLYSQQQYSSLQQQQQSLQSQLGMSSSGSSGLHMLQSEGNSAGGSVGLGGGSFGDFGRGTAGGKHDLGSNEGRGGSSGGDGGETLYLKSAEEGN